MKILLIGHGYVGAYLRPVLTCAGHDVTVCDQNVERLAGVPHAMGCRYQELTISDLADFPVILWFAGHSSVPMSLRDPDGALANNCLDLLHFARRKRTEARLIYASTASVYSVPADHGAEAPPALDESETRLDPLNPYDCSKISIDALARCFANAMTGLRLGTVCGDSPYLRGELIFNAMNIAAMREGYVQVSNRLAHRNILFLEDLAFYVLRLVELRDLPPILNTGSLNTSVGALAEAIAAFHGVPVVDRGNSATYSFRMNCARIQSLCRTPPSATLAERCAGFRAAYRPQLRAAS